MVDAAQYIYRKLKDEHLLTKAFTWDRERDTHNFDIVCVGHSLGAGAAAILAIMLRQEFANTRCFCYSPPGGTLRYRFFIWNHATFTIFCTLVCIFCQFPLTVVKIAFSLGHFL